MIEHFKKYAGRRNENGYLMPVIVILMVVMTSVAYATLIQSNNSLNLSYKEAYIQMAREASKAAIDYSQEQFDNASCGNYSGTAETALSSSSNTRYRVTMQADVQSTSVDGFEKEMKSILKSKPKDITIFVKRDYLTQFVFIEPDWSKLVESE